jgi:hypothetical protein
MGYYIDLVDAEWEITESPESLATIREMPTKYHAIKRGGSSNGEKWFSWMNDTDIETAETVESVFNQLGFETETVDGGFKLVAYIEWRGEDGALWKFEIHNGRMFRSESEIIWTNSQPYTYWHYDLEPATMQGRQINIDPLAPADELAQALKTAKEWDDADQAYYAKLRAEREEAEKANA